MNIQVFITGKFPRIIEWLKAFRFSKVRNWAHVRSIWFEVMGLNFKQKNKRAIKWIRYKTNEGYSVNMFLHHIDMLQNVKRQKTITVYQNKSKWYLKKGNEPN